MAVVKIDKVFYESLFKDLFSDPCQIVFWDGEVVNYGQGEPKFKIILREPIPKADILRDPSLAFGQGYMTEKLDIAGSIQAVLESLYHNKHSFLYNNHMYAKLIRLVANNIPKSKENVEHHYDIGNDFYRLWLDSSMTYSCAYFKSPQDTLHQAQKNKVEHILKKLVLSPGNTLLDIGCGWGELILSAAKQYKVKALGITLSSEQFTAVKQRIESENLQDLVEVQLVDYRELKNRKFDKVVSVGMVEHVGKEHLKDYFSTVNGLLHDGGMSMLHCITSIQGGPPNTWISKYIFPGGYIPAVNEIVSCLAEENLYLTDLESLRRHYAKTLEHWAQNFERALPEVRKTKDESFIKMWRLYLNSSAASFNCGNIDIHQFLFTKGINNALPWTREYIYQ